MHRFEEIGAHVFGGKYKTVPSPGEIWELEIEERDYRTGLIVPDKNGKLFIHWLWSNKRRAVNDKMIDGKNGWKRIMKFKCEVFV